MNTLLAWFYHINKKYRFILILFGGVTVITLSLFYYGRQAEEKLLHKFEQLVQSQAEQGLLISYQEKSLTGMPWKIQLNLKDLSIHHQSIIGWKISRLETVTLTYSPLQHDRLAFESTRPFSIEFDLPQLPSVAVNQVQGEISISDPKHGCTVNLHHVHLKKQTEDLLHAEYLALENTAVKAEPRSEKLLSGIRIAAKNLKGPSIPFDQIQSLQAKLSINGVFKSGSLLQMLKSWTQSGGDIELSDFMIEADKLHFYSEGTLSLDEHLQPLATLTAEVSGVEETIDDLTKRNILSPTLARVYKMTFALALMASQSQDFKIAFKGQPIEGKKLKLSLTLQDQSVNVGGTEIARFPQIDWENFQLKAH